MQPRLRILFAAVVAALVGGPDGAAGAERSLEWRLVDVEARLDSRGDLHVVERQAMVFTGDWNGGERVFRVDAGQRLTLEGVSRIGAGGALRSMAEGDLDAVDHWAWVGSGSPTIRWRSRAPHDPPFDHSEIVYVLKYVLAGVLVDAGDGTYRLAHDFAFPERTGPIRVVRARIEVDPSWETTDLLSLVALDLPPGRGAVLWASLRWVGGGAPLAVAAQQPPMRAPLPRPLRVPLAAVMIAVAAIAALALAFRWVWRHNRARGVFDPFGESVDDAWLSEHVLSNAPEVIGAAWEDRVGGLAVSAVLARMAFEGKLKVLVDREFRFLRPVLHLRLLVDRKSLGGYERRLVDGLFFAGDWTDTQSLRDHYRQQGFDAAALVAPDLREKAHALVPRESRVVGWPALVAANNLFILALAAGLIGVSRGARWFEVAGFGAIGLVLFFASGIAASRLAVAVMGVATPTFATIVPPVIWAAGIAWTAWGGAGVVSAWSVVAQAALWAAALIVVAAIARTPLSPHGVIARRRLAAARRHFALELQQSAPDLQDAWMPYLVALGLGRDVDRWTRVHGASGSGVSSAVPAGTGSGAPTWTGGGGEFAGGGASAVWATLGSISGGVASGSGGSSSGGGGGGGW